VFEVLSIQLFKDETFYNNPKKSIYSICYFISVNVLFGSFILVISGEMIPVSMI